MSMQTHLLIVLLAFLNGAFAGATVALLAKGDEFAELSARTTAIQNSALEIALGRAVAAEARAQSESHGALVAEGSRK